ncbi:MAG: protein kinase [Pirellulaceae bacterium]
MAQCCEPDRLLDLLDEKLPGDEFALLSEHVSSCVECREVLERLSSAQDSMNFHLSNEQPSPQHKLSEAVVGRIARVIRRELEGTANGRNRNPLPHLPPGKTVGDYEIMECMGRGGMGNVFRARHTKLDRMVALKLIEVDSQNTPAVLDGDNRVLRFQREMRAIGRLRHPNIVAALDAGESGRFHYLVMDLLEGPNLQQLVQSYGPLQTADACEIIRQTATGLQHSYEAGIVHRDLKPPNLMLSSSDSPPMVKILDMGLARFFESKTIADEQMTSEGMVVGTLGYLAPEQFGNNKADIRTDIFSLGVTMFFLLTGRSPIQLSGSTLLEKIKSRATTPTMSLSELRPDLPKPLSMLVDRMLSSDPANRPAVPNEIADALTPFCKGHNLEQLLHTEKQSSDRETRKLANHQTLIAPESGLAPDSRIAIAEPRLAERVGNRSWVRNWILIGLAVSFVALAGIVISLKTDGGEIIIECDDPNIELEIVRNDSEVKSFEVGQLKDKTWFRSGDYEIRVPRELGDQIVIDNQQFTLKRGEKILVTIKVADLTKPPAVAEAKIFVPDTQAFYAIESILLENQVVDVYRSRVNSPTNVALGEFSGNENQLFRFVPVDSELYFIESKLAPRYSLDILDWGTADQTNISAVSRGEIETTASKFELIDAGDGTVRIVSAIAPNLHVGVADDDKNIVSRDREMGDRTLFRLKKIEAVPPKTDDSDD